MKKVNIALFSLMLPIAGIMAQTTDGSPKYMTLAECRQQALENNEDMKSASNAQEKANIDKKSAFNGYLPTLDGSLGVLYMKDTDLQQMGTMKMRGAYLAGLQLTQPVYVGGQIVTGNKMAKVGQKAAELQQKRTRMQVLSDVDQAYYTLVSVHEKVKMLKAYDAMMDSLVNKTKISVDAQMATESDLLRVTSQQSQIKYNLEKAQNGERLCQYALCSEVGADFATIIIPTDTVLNIVAPANLSDDISQRPELSLMECSVEAKELNVKKEKSNYLPTVALSASLSYYGNLKIEGTTQVDDGSGNMVPYDYEMNYKDGNWMVMAVASIPLWHWGSEINKVKKAKLELEDSKLELQKNKRLLSIEAQQAIQNLTSGYTMTETAKTAMEQAEDNLRQMRNRYDNSFCTLTDLLQAQTQWQEAKSNLIEAQTQYKIYETEYLRVTGKLE